MTSAELGRITIYGSHQQQTVITCTHEEPLCDFINVVAVRPQQTVITCNHEDPLCDFIIGYKLDA